jgi:perosamine synthetase
MVNMKNNHGKFIGNELKYVQQVLESDMKSATSGGWNHRLETMFAKRFNRRHGIAHNSGTSALHSCLSAIGVGPGDEVISPALTVMMDAFATLHQNGIPVFADINPETFNVNPEDIRRKITFRTKAIIAVHLYGLPADMDAIMKIAKEYDIPVIEDSAQCYLGDYKGRLAGSIGHFSCFSFENSKHISVGEGGIVLTDDETMAEKVRKCGGIGFKNLTADGGRIRLNDDIFQDPDYKRHDTLGWNYRLPELNAAVAVAQLERLDEIVEKRITIAKYFEEAIDGCSWLVPQKVPDGYISSYWTYALKYEGEKAIGVSWKEFRKAYIENGGDGFYSAWSVPYLEPVMQNGNYYGKECPIKCPLYKENISYEKGLCPVAESIQPKIMQFKTNYRDMKLAKSKAMALKKTIDKLEK